MTPITCSCSRLSTKPALEWTEEELDKLKDYNTDEWIRIVTEQDEQREHKIRQEFERIKIERDQKMEEQRKSMSKMYEDRKLALQSAVPVRKEVRRCKFCSSMVKDDNPDLVCMK